MYFDKTGRGSFDLYRLASEACRFARYGFVYQDLFAFTRMKK